MFYLFFILDLAFGKSVLSSTLKPETRLAEFIMAAGGSLLENTMASENIYLNVSHFSTFAIYLPSV